MASLKSPPRPFVSSPLADVSQHTDVNSKLGKKNSFSLRPFPSVAHTIRSSPTSNNNKKTIKLIQPPENQPCIFVLHLTQAELGRQ
ncbi:hypothetical protein BT96DRAFT_914642 [Gymnopus androsaceus JB14]|uniref:Uncharacterized protein n=1 Tax=Gymnopus androsaceus JB14 TaxID=1447944 RepID=A0A6A4I9Q3_9AGAR|nr:hypothetical protein BT96DRAFT_914642 [Gymnopus androsaceus JB14]